jgi:hypothetical protein
MRTQHYLIAVFIAAFAVAANAQTRNAVTPVDQFWANIAELCGKAFEGIITDDTANNPDLAGKRLIIHVRSCKKNRVKIPFFVGEDRSRTWILTKRGNRIQLKHDHRKPDGKPDPVTMYGGTSTNEGEATRQFFPADQQTVKVIAKPSDGSPTAAANVWWIEIRPGDVFIYNLRRLAGPRYFSVKFDITKPVIAPPAPWGWKD